MTYIVFKINNNDIKIPNFIDECHLRGTFKITNKDISEFVSRDIKFYRVKKRNGKYRDVYEPSIHLKYIQKWLLKNILCLIPLNECVHGFVPNKSILTNAKQHAKIGDRWCLRIDIENFFDSINLKSVIELFRYIGYSEIVSINLASLCCYKGAIRQGFPTSPCIANLYLRNFDDFIVTETQRFKEFDIIYTRYADDMIISGLKKPGYTKVIKALKSDIENGLSKINLKINHDKTLIQKSSIKKITGLNVEEDKVFLPTSYVKKIKSDIYYCEKYGIMSHLEYHNICSISNFKGYMYGRCNFLKMIDSNQGNLLIERLDRLKW